MNQTADISNEELKSQIKDIITTDNQTLLQNNDEIIYRVGRRNPVYIVFANVLAYIFLTPISFLILSSDKAIHIFFGALLLLFIVHSFLKAITFKEVIIYKDKVVIDKKIFKKLVIDMNDIKSVYSGGYSYPRGQFFKSGEVI